MAQWMDTVGDEYLKVQFYFNQQHPHLGVNVFAHIISTKPIRPFMSSLQDVWFLDPPNEFHSQRFALRDRGIELEGQKLPNPGHAIPIPPSVASRLSHLYLAILEYNFVMDPYNTQEGWGNFRKQDAFYVLRCEDYDSPVYSRVFMQGFRKPTCNLFSIPNNANHFSTFLQNNKISQMQEEIELLKKRVAQLEKDCHIEFDDVPPIEEE